jgi:hypothetical protein
VICLPIYPSLADEDIERIAAVVRATAVRAANTAPVTEALLHAA